MSPREYFFRNRIYSLRHVADCDNTLIEEWKNIPPITVQLKLPKDHDLPSQFMFCFYWIEVGIAVIEEDVLILIVYEKELIRMIDIGVGLDLILDDIRKPDSRQGSFQLY